jgi:hypothetical protein
MAKPDPRKPDFTYRVGKLKASVWVTPKSDDSGHTYDSITVSLQKSLKQEDETYRDYKVPLFADELGTVIALLQQVQAQHVVKFEAVQR